MSNKYKMLLSPLTVGNITLKNRICYPDACPHFLQGPETWPSDNFRAFYANVAKNGAAYINIAEWNNPLQRTQGPCDSVRMQNFNTNDPSTSNYLSALADEIHFYGSRLSLSAGIFDLPWPEGYSMNGGNGLNMPGPPTANVYTEQLPAERMGEVAEAFAERVAEYASYGYDILSLNISFFLCKFFNKRTDEFGCGSPKSAAGIPGALFRAVKKRLGKGFPIECYVYGEWDHAYTTEWLIEALKELDDCIDIISIKEKDAAQNHPTGFQFTKGYHPNLGYAKKMKDAGITKPIALNGGYQDPAEMESYLEQGICDMFSMARGLYADPEYYKKILDDKAEDIMPCLWCNKCHGVLHGPWITYCSVNPCMGMDNRVSHLLEGAGTGKKIAVIGGGPIGLRFALMADKQGHQVTLYEKTSTLGGQLFHADYSSFKWPLRDHKNWLIEQVKKSGVQVLLNTEATPEVIAVGKYDAVVAATGAAPNFPAFEGLRDENGQVRPEFLSCLDVYGNEDKIGKRVVIVGGSETGAETGMHLAELGHEVTVLTRQDEIAKDASHLHHITMAIVYYEPDGREVMKCAWEKYPNFHGVVNANTKAVTPTSVTYVDGDGKEVTLDCDTVVICGGMKSNAEAAKAFYGTAPRFFMIGDCNQVANLQVGNRAALGVLAQL